MIKKREMRKIDPVSVGLPQETSLQNAAIFDHLTPRLKQLLAHAKKVKEDNNFRFCWTKNSVIYLYENLKIHSQLRFNNKVIWTSFQHNAEVDYDKSDIR